MLFYGTFWVLVDCKLSNWNCMVMLEVHRAAEYPLQEVRQEREGYQCENDSSQACISYKWEFVVGMCWIAL